MEIGKVKFFRSLTLILVLFLSVIGCTQQNVIQALAETKILGGTIVEKDDPIVASTVAIHAEIPTENDFYTCTGTLIAHDLVLTAAHCAYHTDAVLTVVFGNKNNPEDAEAISMVDEIRVHPDYAKIRAILNRPADQRTDAEKKELFNGWSDLAVLKLQIPAPSSFRPVPLFDGSLKTGDSIELAGFGISQISDAGETDDGKLRKVTLPIYRYDFNTSEFLVDQRKDQGSCRGDSGGPAYVTRENSLYLVGVSSHGILNVQTCNGFSAVTKVNASLEWLHLQLNSRAQ